MEKQTKDSTNAGTRARVPALFLYLFSFGIFLLNYFCLDIYFYTHNIYLQIQPERLYMRVLHIEPASILGEL